MVSKSISLQAYRCHILQSLGALGAVQHGLLHLCMALGGQHEGRCTCSQL